eukprot:561731-Rhodomonas_salina.1
MGVRREQVKREMCCGRGRAALVAGDHELGHGSGQHQRGFGCECPGPAHARGVRHAHCRASRAAGTWVQRRSTEQHGTCGGGTISTEELGGMVFRARS